MRRRSRAALAAIILGLILPALGLAESSENPFIPGSRAGTGEAKKTPDPPGLGGSLLSILVPVQARLNEALAGATRAAALGSGQGGGFLLLLGLAFAYGVVHAAGPGHGKTVVASRVLAEDTSPAQIALAGGLTALVHASSAAAVSTILLLLARVLFTQGLASTSRGLGLVGSLLLLGLGLGMGFEALHHHREGGGTPSAHGRRGERASLVLAAMGAALVPCPGATAVFVLAVTLGSPLIGLVAVVAMSLGMAITISSAGFLAWSLRRAGKSLGSGRRAKGLLLGLSLLGSLGILLVGLLGLLNALG